MTRPSGEQHDALVGASSRERGHDEGCGENRHPGIAPQDGLRLHRESYSGLEARVMLPRSRLPNDIGGTCANGNLGESWGRELAEEIRPQPSLDLASFAMVTSA